MNRFKFEIDQIVEVIAGNDAGKLVKVYRRYACGTKDTITTKCNGKTCVEDVFYTANWYGVEYLEDESKTADFIEHWLMRHVETWKDWTISLRDTDSENEMSSSSPTAPESTELMATSLTMTTSL